MSPSPPHALLLDCDGVLAETERDGHRVAFNQAFAAAGLATRWSVAAYGPLLAFGGGKERMTRFFEDTGWPTEPLQERQALVARLHADKSRRMVALVEAGDLPPRPGIRRLVTEALDAALPVAICSTSQEHTVAAIARHVLGPEVAARVPVFAGDCVPAKKPDPAIYRLAAARLGVDPAACLVIEDSAIGLAAGRAAGMTVVVTPSVYTQGEAFAGAALVLPDLGEDTAPRLTLAACRRLMTGDG